MSGSHDHSHPHEHPHDHEHGDEPCWKHDGVRVIKGDQLESVAEADPGDFIYVPGPRGAMITSELTDRTGEVAAKVGDDAAAGWREPGPRPTADATCTSSPITVAA